MKINEEHIEGEIFIDILLTQEEIEDIFNEEVIAKLAEVLGHVVNIGIRTINDGDM